MTAAEVRDPVLELAGGLIVSCQAPPGSPLRDPEMTARIALAAVLGGAAGLRINGPEDVGAVRAVTKVPIVALHKVTGRRRNLITPTSALADGLVRAGADVVAVDGTAEAAGEGMEPPSAFFGDGRVIMADVSTLDEGLRSWDLGVAFVATTLSGYTPGSPTMDGPDLALVESLVRHGVRTVAEGRYRTPEQVVAAFDVGAHAVVVGGAITDPLGTTRRFLHALGGAPR